MNDKFVYAPETMSVRENARIEKTVYALNVIDNGLKDFGFNGNESLITLFNKYLEGWNVL